MYKFLDVGVIFLSRCRISICFLGVVVVKCSRACTVCLPANLLRLLYPETHNAYPKRQTKVGRLAEPGLWIGLGSDVRLGAWFIISGCCCEGGERVARRGIAQVWWWGAWDFGVG